MLEDLIRETTPTDHEADREAAAELRIIGGRFRRRKLVHRPRRGTRPMKERVREAIFNLVGPECRGRHATISLPAPEPSGSKR